MPDSKPKSKRRSASRDNNADWLEDVQQLSYQDARTALDLAMAQLQSSDLEVEQIADLYRRAEAYAQRCQSVLESVEQQVIEWDDVRP